MTDPILFACGVAVSFIFLAGAFTLARARGVELLDGVSRESGRPSHGG